MRFQSKYSIIGIAMAVMFAMLAIVPALAATTGTITVNRAFVAPGGEATVTVDDADLNVSAAAATITVDVPIGALGNAYRVHLATVNGKELLDDASLAVTAVAGSGAGSTTTTDWAVATGFSAPGNAFVDVVRLVTTTDTVSVDVQFKVHIINTIKDVTVTSAQDGTGIKIDLAETSANSGSYAGNFTVTVTGAIASSDTTDTLLALPGQDITITYTDGDPAGKRVATVRVENTKPVTTLVSPANSSVTTSQTPKLTVDVTDGDSGVDAGKIAITIASAVNDAGADVSGTVTLGTITTTSITGGSRGEISVATGGKDGETTIIDWTVSSADVAGNTNTSDSDSALAGSQPYRIIIDRQAPDFAASTASAGAWWDAANEAVETDATKSVTNIIGIKLPDPVPTSSLSGGIKEALNAATVDAADFEVDTLKQADGTTISDLTPTNAEVFAGAPNWIFLTVPAMAPDAKPVVILKDAAGGISDNAGNIANSGTVTAVDKQAAVLTVSLSTDLDKAKTTVSIASNETTGLPGVTYNGTSVSVTPTGVNSYSATVAPSTDGVYAIVVSATDGGSNTTTKGNALTTTDFPTSKSLPFYRDADLADPTVTVGTDTAAPYSDEQAQPFFLIFTYTDEGLEYGISPSGTMYAPATNSTDDADVHNTVTVTKAELTLDGETTATDVLAIVESQDSITFTIPVADIPTGDHSVEITSEDAIGNTKKTTTAFTVTARKAYSLPLTAGWNLVSLPGDPADASIDAVLPASHPATTVLSFQNGEWLVATRVAGATWEGTLTTINSRAAYWINTSAGTPIKALLSLPSVGAAVAPPTVSISKGWNMIPIIDLAQASAGSTLSTAAAYLTSVNWSVAYSYTASSRTWARLTPSAGSVVIGNGYWVWAEAAGTLVP